MSKATTAMKSIDNTATIHQTPESSPFTPPHKEFPPIDKEKPAFALSVPNHNLILHLEDSRTNSLCPWTRCHKCSKWRKFPRELFRFGLSLPNSCPNDLVLTPAQLALIPASYSTTARMLVTAPFTCSQCTWDLDLQVCGAPQHVQDISTEWAGQWLPLKFFRTASRFDFLMCLTHFLRLCSIPREYPWIGNKPIDLYGLYTAVHQLRGLSECDELDAWSHFYTLFKLPEPAQPSRLRDIYIRFFFEIGGNESDESPVEERIALSEKQTALPEKQPNLLEKEAEISHKSSRARSREDDDKKLNGSSTKKRRSDI